MGGDLLQNRLAAAAASFGYIVWVYTTVYGRIEHDFPEPVAKKLRRAVYYSSVAPDLAKAMRFYSQALALCEQHGRSSSEQQRCRSSKVSGCFSYR